MTEITARLALEAVADLVCSEGMLDPGLSNLLKALVVPRSTAHSIEVVRDNGMVGRRQRGKIHDLVSGIAASRAYAQANLGAVTSKLGQDSKHAHVSRDDIGSGVETLRSVQPSRRRCISRSAAQEKEQ
ncbi:MAG: hypothetical protein DMF06_11660 [Verrucomicrobia bacterium]|nr:MAG: hypothetical protein DMF06_11660 [Verrucomicrobiota bacterium]